MESWNLVLLPFGKKIVNCRWVYVAKVGPSRVVKLIILNINCGQGIYKNLWTWFL